MTDYTVNSLSVTLGMDRRTIADRFRDVEPARIEGRSKLYTLAQVITVLAADFLPSGDVDINEAKRRRELALATLAELDVQERQGALIPATDVQTVWSGMLVNARSKFLGMPSKLTPILFGADQQSIQTTITREVHAALSEMADYDPAQYDLPDAA